MSKPVKQPLAEMHQQRCYMYINIYIIFYKNVVSNQTGNDQRTGTDPKTIYIINMRQIRCHCISHYTYPNQGNINIEII